MIKVEFTIEPFVEGEPPARVTLAVAAIEATGVVVEIGVFGSSFTATEEQIGPAVAALVQTAHANGATHVTITTEQLDK